MVKVIFFDIDGTLVPMGTKHLTDSNLKAIKLLQKKGIKCVLCSGRDIKDISHNNDILDNVHFDGIIASTGQYCVDQNNQPFFIKYLNEHQTKELVTLFNERKYSVCLKTENGTYVNYVNDIAKEIFESLNVDGFPIGEYKGERIFQGLIYALPEDRKKLEKELSDIKFTSWHPNGTDLIPFDGGKNKGIEMYLKKENVKIEETMAFGDGENDIDMLEYVNIGVAMGNSGENTKKCADYVTDDCDKEGIYKALKHFNII